MTCHLKETLDSIQAGSTPQLTPTIRVPWKTMTVGQRLRFDLPFDCTFLAMAQFIQDGSVFNNCPYNGVFGVQINREDAPMIPFSLTQWYSQAFLGPVRTFWVTLFAAPSDPTSHDFGFFGGRDCGMAMPYVVDGRG